MIRTKALLHMRVILQLSKVLCMFVVELGYPLVFVGFFFTTSHIATFRQGTIRDNETV